MNPSEDTPPPAPVEIEPLALRPVERYTSPLERSFRLTSEAVDTSPIPSHPLHQCPNCDYLLTGLTSRRCPECGEPFNVIEARMHAIELSEGVRRVLRGERIEEVKMYVGVALLVLSVWIQNVTTGSVAGWLGVRMTYRGLLMLIFMVPLWSGAAVFKVSGDRQWAEAIWLAGLIAAGLGVFMATL